MATRKKSADRGKGCTCVKQINDQLKPFNTMISPVYLIDFTTSRTYTGLEVLTEKIDSKVRGRKKSLLCIYCPFCGKKLKR